jgi:O-methyltransferase
VEAFGHKALNLLSRLARHPRSTVGPLSIYPRYRRFTMLGVLEFEANLRICASLAPSTGCIVECGVWRGGMSAAMADILPGRAHFLFDSFEGLPAPTEADGEGAVIYQNDTTSTRYFDNCRAEISYATTAMNKSHAAATRMVRGWFKDTIPSFTPPEPIAVLRIDGDWYESTMSCLEGLYRYVLSGGLIILDDYGRWDGCSRAVHDFLSRDNSAARIRELDDVFYCIKP